jgi:hypothetical protein
MAKRDFYEVLGVPATLTTALLNKRLPQACDEAPPGQNPGDSTTS